MKITFFVNEESENPRRSYLCERGKWLSVPFSLAKWKSRTNFILSVVVMVALVLYLRVRIPDPVNIAAIFVLMLLLLPLHEFSHVLFYVLSGHGVDTVRFFPDVRTKRPVFSRLGGCVFPSIAAFSRTEVVLAHLFPLLLLTLLPLLLCFLFPAARPALFGLAIVNLGGSSFDLCDAAAAVRMPRGAVKVDGSWYLPEDRSPYVIYRFCLSPDHRSVQYQAFRFTDGRAAEIPAPPLSAQGEALIGDFKAQFHL